MPAEPVRVNWSTKLAEAPGASPLPTLTPIKGEPDGAAQLVWPAAFASVALLLRLSTASDIGPEMKLPPVLRIVTFCWNRPVPKLKENPPRVMLTGALMSLAQAHALMVKAFEPEDKTPKRGTGELASAIVTKLKGAKAV